MMTLTQPSRLAGPSWDEEVVPALRKRLESESRTLARRMSAISLSSVEEPSSANYATYADSTHRQRQISPQTNYSQQTYASTAQAPQASYQRQPVPDRTTTGRSNGNGIAAPNPQTKTVFQRARTYSSPYGSDATNSHANGRPKPTAKSTDPARSLSPRPVDIKPTRIPKASRTPVSVASSSTGSPYTNGSSHDPVVAPFSLSPEPSDQIAAQRGIITSSSTQTTVDLPSRSRHTPVLLNESPPFPTDTTMSSGFTQRSATRNAPVEEAPPRPSTDSEERPYEHWYRGEASRNGGVGELRVGRRQEMLDIANYGHMIENRQAAKRMAPMDVQEDTPRARKRAGSIAGITNKERHRGSLYLDEDNIDEAGRALDEHPLTDLDGEGSEVQSVSDAYDGGAYAYLPEVGDTPSTEWTTVAGAHERSITPTANSMLPRPSSRQQQTIYVPPTRIPGPSSRRSSESRSTVNSSPAVGGNTPIHFSGNTAMHVSKSSPSNSRQLNYLNNASPGSAQKRGGSPASRKGRGAAPKVVKSKTLPGKKGEDAKRGSVAYYPTPMGDEEDMADAIPSWTQPIPREGNWDDVVLPVVARKKGLGGYYEEADGSPKPKKVDRTVAPAPGTFGFDGTKYRPPRGDFEAIPMDEFGRSAEQPREGVEVGPMQYGTPTAHDDIQLPHRQQSPSPAPFAHYAPTNGMQQVRPLHPLGAVQQGADAAPPIQQMQQEEKANADGGSGCCKCVIM